MIRWRLAITASKNDHLLTIQQIMERTQYAAEVRSINLLRARRLVDPAGDQWDRWTLGRKLKGERHWTVVAHGDWRAIVSTTRERAEREAFDGIA
jgi:hypothetical protein